MVEDVPDNGRRIRNLAMGANYLMSHILHFYHLAALDYVDVNGTGLIPKGFTCPNYDNNYYARGIDPVLQTTGLTKPAYSVNAYDYANSTWKNTGGANTPSPPALAPGIDWNPSGAPAFQPAFGDLTAYFAGQYVRALKMRRLAQQLGAMFTGKMPHASMYTPACVTTKCYNPTVGGTDAAVVRKMHELLYGGPSFNIEEGAHQHPYNGRNVSESNPHPESLLGFIGKPSDFWKWAAGFDDVSQTVANPGAVAGVGGALYNGGSPYTYFDPQVLPVWAKAGIPAAGGNWQTYTGTYLFDVVAAAHVFPEYFWIGSGHNRFLAWGIFEGTSDALGPPANGALDKKMITRGRVHIPQNPNGSGNAYAYVRHSAKHGKCKEFTTNSSYYEPRGVNAGRHMWDGYTRAIPLGHPALGGLGKAGAYTYAKTPRYLNAESAPGWEDTDHLNNKYLPYEVGPLARMMSNADLLAISGGPASLAEVIAVDAGAFGCYYPGMLHHVDVALNTAFAIPNLLAPASGIGVMAGWPNNITGTANLATHLTVLQTAAGAGKPALYLPPNAISVEVLLNSFGNDYQGGATLDRIAARALETYYVARQMLSWFNELDPPAANRGAKKLGDPGYNPLYPYDSRWPNYTRYFTWGGSNERRNPYRARGAGLTEAPRGALGHWITINQGKVNNYQIITPTAWNINPKDALNVGEKTTGAHGPIEECIVGTPLVNESEPIEVLRVIHSFDPCCACTVHVMNAKKEKVFKETLEALI